MGQKMSPCCKTVQCVKNPLPLMVTANVVLFFLGNRMHSQYKSTITGTTVILVHGKGIQFR